MAVPARYPTGGAGPGGPLLPPARDPLELPLAQAWSWQDARALCQGLAPLDQGPLLLPAADGDDALALLAAGGARVLAAAATPGERAWLELKQAAAITFPTANSRQVLGLDEAGRRVFLYHYLRDRVVEGRAPPPPALSEAARRFWSEREQALRLGIAPRCALERGLARVRPLLGLLVSPARLARDLARPPGAPEPSWAGRRLVAILELGLRGALSGAEARARARQLHRRLHQGPAPLLDWVLLGRFLPDSEGPVVLGEAGRLALVARGPAIEIQDGGLDAVLAMQAPSSLAGIFLGADPSATRLAAAARALRPGGRLLLRAPVAPALPAGAPWLQEGAAELQAQDRSLLPGELWRLVRR